LLATKDTGMGGGEGITTEVDVGMDKTTVVIGVAMDVEDLEAGALVEVVSVVASEVLVAAMLMVEDLEEVMDTAEGDVADGTMEEGLAKTEVRMVEDLVWVVEEEVVVEEVECRVDRGVVDTLLL